MEEVESSPGESLRGSLSLLKEAEDALPPSRRGSQRQNPVLTRWFSEPTVDPPRRRLGLSHPAPHPANGHSPPKDGDPEDQPPAPTSVHTTPSSSPRVTRASSPLLRAQRVAGAQGNYRRGSMMKTPVASWIAEPAPVEKHSLGVCMQSVLELKAAGVIFSLISGRSSLLTCYQDAIRIIVLNLAFRRVRPNSPLRRLLKKFNWLDRAEDLSAGPRFDVTGFRDALCFMYLSLKNVVALDNSPLALTLSYCPTTLVKLLQQQLQHSSDVRVSKMVFFGTCMLADISGFTLMSAAFSKIGAEGLEVLHRITNDLVGKIVEIVYSCGGDVIAFAGDAIICVFEDAYFTSSGHSDEPSNVSQRRLSLGSSDNDSGVKALLCAEEITKRVPLLFDFTEIAKDVPELMRPETPFQLKTHVALSHGEMSLGALGGVENKWVFLLNGQCVSELGSCIHDAGTGEIVITAKLFEKIKLNHQGEMKANFIASSGNFRISTLEGTVHRVSPDQRLSEMAGYLCDQQLQRNISLFVPPPALDAIRHETFFLLTAINEVTTMFLDLNTYDRELHQDPLSLQPFFEV